MATAIRAFNFEKTVMVSPQCVKHFESGRKKHATNKKVAVGGPKVIEGENLKLLNLEEEG